MKQMKKIISFGLSLILILSVLAACGGTGQDKKAGTEESGEKKSALSGEDENREIRETGFFRISYPEGWKVSEEESEESEKFQRIVLFRGKSAEEASEKIRIIAAEEEASGFRTALHHKGIDLRAYAEGTAETISCGGADFAAADTAVTGSREYLYRHEPSGVTYYLTVDKSEHEELMEEVLGGLELKLTDEGNTDSPWPWEGKAFTPVLKEQLAGTFKIVPEPVPFEESHWVTDIMDHQFVVNKGKLYHLLGTKLTTYQYTGKKLIRDSEMELDQDCEYITADRSGMLYLSPGIGKIFGVKDNKKVMETTVTGDLNMHPSGKWGITSWVGSDTQKVTKKGDILSAEPWILTGMSDPDKRKGIFSMISEISITDHFIMAAGKTAGEDSREKIVVYDHKGKEKVTLGADESLKDDSLGSITGMVETKNGFMASDGNMRALQFWKKDGTYIGKIDAADLFGTSYPWFEDLQLLPDGSVLLALTQNREDDSSYELMFFRLTGF